MTKNEMIDKCTMRLGRLQRPEVELAVNSILDIMSKTLANDDRIEIRGFGSFCNHHIKAKIGRNPLSGEAVQVKAKKNPHFKMGKELKERVNATL